MSRLFRWPAVLLLLAVTAPAIAKTKPCTSVEAAVAEGAMNRAQESWAILNAQYRTHFREMDCDDGAIAEGWDDAVVRLLANSWSQVPALDRFAKADPDFLPFVVHHIGATAATEDLERVRANAEDRCPSSQYADLCRLIAEAAAAALTAPGCSYPSPPADEPEARRRLAGLTPGVRWSTVLRVDLVGRGVPDFVMLEKTRSEAVVGVVMGIACDMKFVFRFRKDSGSQEGLCASPGMARLSATALASSEDPDAPLAARGGVSTRRAGFRLDSGECDSFHFYFDGLAVRWWRR